MRHLIELQPGRVRCILTRDSLDNLDPAIVERGVFGFRGHRPAQVYWLYNEAFLRRALRRSAPVVFHSTDFNGLVVSSRVATVATLHDIMAFQPGRRAAGADVSRRLSDWRWAVYFRRLRSADRIITVSQFVKEEAVRLLDLDPSRIVVIHPGVDRDVFSPGPSAPAPAFPYFFYVGSMDANKNIPRLLQAFAKLHRRFPDASLKLAGPWRAQDTQSLHQQCDRLGISDSTDLLGRVDQQHLVSLYREAAAFVFPSLSEGFGSPLVEAMACGAALITSAHGAMSEVSGDAAVKVDPRSVDELSRAMEVVLTSPRLAGRLRRRAHHRAALFDWHHVARRTWDVYREAARAHAAGV